MKITVTMISNQHRHHNNMPSTRLGDINNIIIFGQKVLSQQQQAVVIRVGAAQISLTRSIPAGSCKLADYVTAITIKCFSLLVVSEEKHVLQVVFTDTICISGKVTATAAAAAAAAAAAKDA
uniref:Uncharacterized protein n=1 Tax=Glossina pallidipes TaxID=7398 RepID=A0A1B0A4C5_GLOPL